MRSASASSLLLVASLAGRSLVHAQTYTNCSNPSWICNSYGVDYQENGNYFQNTNVNNSFTFLTQFTQCQNDVTINFLVDADGDEYQCTNTTMQPDNTNQLSICPIENPELFTGSWSIVVLSNNGQCAPLAQEVDFSLVVGPQQTYTMTPTVIFTNTVTPIANVTTTTTTTVITTAPPPYTVTKPSSTQQVTLTKTPAPVTVTSTTALKTATLTLSVLSIAPIYSTVTASCHLPTRAAKANKLASITPTAKAAAKIQAKASAKAKLAKAARGVPYNVPVDAGERKVARLARRAALQKRSPDQATLTVTQQNPSLFVVLTSTSYAPTQTTTTTSTITSSSTTTPAPVTVYSGIYSTPVYVTAPTSTSTKTKLILVTFVLKTTTVTYRPVISTTTTLAAASSSCVLAGGKIF